MIRFLYRNLAGWRRLVGVAIVLAFVGAASNVLMAIPLKLVLDKIVNHRDPQLPAVDALIAGFDRYGSRQDLDPTEANTLLGVVLFAGTMALALGVISAVVSYVQLAIAAFVGQGTGARLRSRLFVHLEHVCLAWHSRERVGDIVQRISGNVTEIEKLVADGLVDLLSGILTLLGILVVMVTINWQFTVLSMGIAPPLFVVVLCYTRWVKRASKEASRAAGQVAQLATESVNAIAELKAYTLEQWAARTFTRQSERQRRAGLRAGRRQAEFNPLVIILITVSSVAIITVGAWVAAGHGLSVWFLAIPAGSLTIGSLTVFLAYSKLLYQPMRDLSKLMLLVSTGASAAERIQEVLDAPREELSCAGDGHGPTDVRGDLVFAGVVFGYEERPVLGGVDLAVPVGTRLALVGLSGSGKTTLARLLPRFYEPWEGRVTIGGVDVRDYPLDLLRRNIGFVMQDSVLFEGTVRENIALGRQDATEAEIRRAAEAAYLQDTIVALPGGYDAPVFEQGRNFSSGQRQRIAIARAFLRDAPILVLDEPTANLDVEAEAQVMRAIERLTAGRTVIVISHRLSTLGQVDEIAVLEAGTIVERGTYQQLKARGGAFARLLAEQHRYSAESVDLGGTNGVAPTRLVGSTSREDSGAPLT